MKYTGLFFLVEGDDDERLFRKVIEPIFRRKFDFVKIVKYAKTREEKVRGFLKSIKGMGASYFYVADINLAPCVTARKQGIQQKFANIDEHRIVVVVKEIESWYIAGLDNTSSKKLGLPEHASTDGITKEKFDNLMPKKFDSRINFTVEILESFSVEAARQKNTSFRYFLGKHNCHAS